MICFPRFDLLVRAWRGRAEVSAFTGDYDRSIAEYDELLAVCRKNKHVGYDVIADLTVNLAWAMFYKSSYDESRRLVQKVLPAAKRNKSVYVRGLQMLGNIALDTSSPRVALRYYKQAVRIAGRTQQTPVLGTLHHNMGLAQNMLGQYSAALRSFKVYLKIGMKTGDLQAVSITYRNMAVAHRELGHSSKALHYLRKSLDIAERIGSQYGSARCLMGIGIIHRRRGELEKALIRYHESLSIAEKVGNQSLAAALYSNIGIVYHFKGDFQNALRYYLKAMAVAKKIGYKKGEPDYLQNIAHLYRDQGKYEKATEYYVKALKIFKQAKNLHSIGIVYLGIARNYLAKERLGRAIDFYRKARAIFNKSRDITYLTELDAFSAEILLKQKKYKAALERARNAKTRSKRTHAKEHEISAARAYACSLAHFNPHESLVYLNSVIADAGRYGWLFDKAKLMLERAKILKSMNRKS